MRNMLKCIMGVAILGLVGGMALAQMAPSVSFTTAPSPGANAGEIATAVKWANCAGITKVKIYLYKANPNGGNIAFTDKEYPSTLQNGSWAYTFTGLTSKTVITAATVEVLNGATVIKSDTVAPLNVTVP